MNREDQSEQGERLGPSKVARGGCMLDAQVSICYFSNSEVRGGVEEHILTLLRRLDRSLFRPILVCPPLCAEKLRQDLPSDVRLFPIRLERPYQASAVLRLARILRSNNVQILHSHMFKASIVGSPIARLCGVPAIIETTHLREAWRHGWIKGNYAIDRFAGRFVDQYIAVSEANARYLTEDKRIPPEKVHLIHNGCDLARFQPGHHAPEDMKQKLGFGEKDPVVIVIGRLEPQKGHRFLLEAHTRVVSELPNAKLVCIGEGALRGELERLIEALHIEKAVRFLGFQSNVLDWLALADVSVLPSLFEGLPLVAVETLAAGCPMVATAVDGTVEVVVDQQTGLTVPPEDSEALARAILRLIQDREYASKLAQQGRQWVLEHFTQEQQVRKTEHLYLNALEKSAKGAKETMTAAQSPANTSEPLPMGASRSSAMAKRE